MKHCFLKNEKRLGDCTFMNRPNKFLIECQPIYYSDKTVFPFLTSLQEYDCMGGFASRFNSERSVTNKLCTPLIAI